MRSLLKLSAVRDLFLGIKCLLAVLLLAMYGCQAHRTRAPAADASDRTASEGSETETASEPSPPPSGPWVPVTPVASKPGEIAWSEVALDSSCIEAPEREGNASTVNIITTEADFEQAYCRSSELDWNRFRLVVIHYVDHLVDLTVVRDDPHVRVFLRTRSSCEAQWGGRVHLLLPANDAPVIAVRKAGPPADCTEGYAY